MPSVKFKTRQDGYGRAKHVWACKNCTYWHYKKPVKCDVCKQTEFYYLASEKEAEHLAELQLLLAYDQISELETQVNFILVVEGYKITKYVADFVYRDDEGKLVVEDIKANIDDKFLTPEFKIKCRLMKALHNIDVQIIKRR